MKTKHIILPIILGGMLAITSCDDDINRELSPEVLKGCQGAFFPSTNTSNIELEPSEPTEITLTISRTATDAATIPIIADINEYSIFNVPESVSFASGETSKDIKVTFPNAREGTTYILKLKVEGDEFVNSYASTVSWVQTSVTRIQWVDVKEPGVMQEGIVGTFFGVGLPPFYVQMQKASLGNSTSYRLVNPFRAPSKYDADGDPIPDDDGIYDGYPYNVPDDMVDGEYLMVITISDAGNVTVDPFEMGFDWGYGMLSSGSIYGFVSTDIDSYPLGTINGDIISFPESSLYCSMAGYQGGGRFPAKATTLYLTKEAYLEANSSITDYNDVECKKVDGAISAFASAAFDQEWDQELWAAIDQKEDDEDSPYKNLFYLPDLYSEGLGLAFYENEGKITIIKNQPTGIKFLDNDIYVSPSESLTSGIEVNKSTGLKTYSFGLNFHLEDGTSLGDFTETLFYGKNEIKRSIDDFCGVFDLSATSGIYGSSIEYTVTITKEKDGKTLKINGLLDPEEAAKYNYSVDDVFATFSSTDNSVTLEPQELDEKFVYGGAEYPVLFITYSSSEDEIYDDQSINIICRYNNVLKFTSYKDNDVNINGYAYYVPGLGVLDYIPYNITLTPSTASSKLKSGVIGKTASFRNMPLLKGANKTPAITTKSGNKVFSLGNFNLQQKSNVKKRTLLNDIVPVI